ncbi:MAG: Tol biopolymer transport system component [Reinekea sp.]
MISELCLCDLKGEVSIVMRHAGHIEAPNWHPDGYLIVNGDGGLFRVAFDNPVLEPIDTGFAKACNNDHGISPDGATLVISDKSRTVKSCIYTVPVAGGMPRRITADVPSWWHGWSPDGTTLVYVGARGDRVIRLYTMDLKTQTETMVCDGFDHVDGPDYSPDGQWIWFNGEREGQVELWRVRPDGTDLEQMTDDDLVNWFPHPSPDGKHVLFLAYPVGTQGHPANLDVRLRLMPLAGGPPRDIAKLFGGQGTINVPCWSPDAKCFAFMRYVA